MSNEPNKMLLRLNEVVAWTGLNEQAVLKAVECGSLKRIRVHETARGVYNKEDVKKLISNGWK
jgi:hypothetical protein